MPKKKHKSSPAPAPLPDERSAKRQHAGGRGSPEERARFARASTDAGYPVTPEQVDVRSLPAIVERVKRKRNAVDDTKGLF